MTHKYRCEACGGEYEAERSDADARDEAEWLFGERPETHKMAVVCEDCFQQMARRFGWPIEKPPS